MVTPHNRSIVNGLRDDDEESFYGNRTSFVSEYSVRDDGVQMFFKEHGRTGSKDSQSSFLSRKRPSQAQKRPETKVRSILKSRWIRVLKDGRSTIMPGLLQFSDRTPHYSLTTSRMALRPALSTFCRPLRTGQGQLSSPTRPIGPSRSAYNTCSTRSGRHSQDLFPSRFVCRTNNPALICHLLSFAR